MLYSSGFISLSIKSWQATRDFNISPNIGSDIGIPLDVKIKASEALSMFDSGNYEKCISILDEVNPKLETISISQPRNARIHFALYLNHRLKIMAASKLPGGPTRTEVINEEMMFPMLSKKEPIYISELKLYLKYADQNDPLRENASKELKAYEDIISKK